jgi:serine/threonine protein kinase
MAPEMYEERGYSEKVDVYAFGMCLLEMVVGEYPYAECKNAAQIYKKVTSGQKPACLEHVKDPECLDIINRCLCDEHERLTVQECLSHTFLAVEPEVSLISMNEENSKQLTLQVVFRGTDKMSVKFDFNMETDTADDVVKEMVTLDLVFFFFWPELIFNEQNIDTRERASGEVPESHHL